MYTSGLHVSRREIGQPLTAQVNCVAHALNGAMIRPWWDDRDTESTVEGWAKVGLTVVDVSSVNEETVPPEPDRL